MTGVELIGKPTVRGVEVPTEIECYTRQIIIHGHTVWINTFTGNPQINYNNGDGGAQSANYAGSIDAWMEYDICLLEPGSWTAVFQIRKGPEDGIARWSIDGTVLGADIDGYATEYSFFNYITRTFTVASEAKTSRLRMTVVGKNASSTNYYILFARIHLYRTGA